MREFYQILNIAKNLATDLLRVWTLKRHLNQLCAHVLLVVSKPLKCLLIFLSGHCNVRHTWIPKLEHLGDIPTIDKEWCKRLNPAHGGFCNKLELQAHFSPIIK